MCFPGGGEDDRGRQENPAETQPWAATTSGRPAGLEALPPPDRSPRARRTHAAPAPATWAGIGFRRLLPSASRTRSRPSRPALSAGGGPVAASAGSLAPSSRSAVAATGPQEESEARLCPCSRHTRSFRPSSPLAQPPSAGPRTAPSLPSSGGAVRFPHRESRGRRHPWSVPANTVRTSADARHQALLEGPGSMLLCVLRGPGCVHNCQRRTRPSETFPCGPRAVNTVTRKARAGAERSGQQTDGAERRPRRCRAPRPPGSLARRPKCGTRAARPCVPCAQTTGSSRQKGPS